jgi:hypothetical protein
VASVLAQVNGYPVGPAKLGKHRGMDRVRLHTHARLAHGGDMVYVHAKFSQFLSP